MTGVSRLVIFTVIVICSGTTALVYGFAQQAGRGVPLIVLGIVAVASIAVMWSAIAVTQRRRRDLEPPR